MIKDIISFILFYFGLIVAMPGIEPDLQDKLNYPGTLDCRYFLFLHSFFNFNLFSSSPV